MAEGINGNGKLTTWLLGIFGTILILILGFIINALLSLNTRIGTLEVLGAGNLEKIKHLETSTLTIIPDKMEYIVKHSELINKVSLIEGATKLLETRLSTISERILTVNTRLDTITFQDGIKEKLKKE